MRYVQILIAIIFVSPDAAYASNLQDGMRPESNAICHKAVVPGIASRYLRRAFIALHESTLLHPQGDSPALRSGMRPE
jgi:hypothetical protein